MKITLLFFLSIAMTTMAQCPEAKLQVKRLPSLHVPRAGHAVFVSNGELTVAGGHTSGFVPTATAEYYSNGEWHLVNTTYTHDQGLCVPMSDGCVLIAGGHERELGIGQTFTVEMYHPDTHTFEGFGCLDKKRCFASGIEIDSGRVVVSGNWYTDDGIEMFDGSRQLTALRPVAQQRSNPYMLRTTNDNVIIFSTSDEHGDTIDNIIVDRIKGEPFTVPLFSTWRPKYMHLPPHSEDCCIGNGRYLISVEDSTGQLAIASVQDEDFQLLPTTCPVPMESHGQRINYYSAVVADSSAHRAYIVGCDADIRLYVLSINYENNPASLILYCSEPQSPMGLGTPPVLTSDGQLALIGGTQGNNYVPSDAALLLCVGSTNATEQRTTADASGQRSTTWLWIAGSLLLAASMGAGWLAIRKRKAKRVQQSEAVAPNEQTELMERLCQLMDQQQLYRNSNLKLQDVADMLHTNRTYINDCIKATRRQTFTQFVNAYRIEYAKQQLTNNPDKKMSAIAIEAGFTTDAWFFRTFKAVTGITPNEWRAQQTQ